MKIALDVQSLFEEKKTGIGWTVKMMTENLLKNDENEFVLNCFTFRKYAKKREVLENYKKNNVTLQNCRWMISGVYRRIGNILPVPYTLFFRKKVDVTQFFNYVIPPGVQGIKSVFIYDMVYKAYPETMQKETRAYMEAEMERSCKCADLIITISEFSKREIIKYMNVDPQKIEVVYCGIDHDLFHNKIENKDVEYVKEKYGLGEKYFLYLGTLEPRKNINVIIKAYAKLKQDKDDLIPKLVLAGKYGWECKNIFDLVKELKLENEVILPGYVDEKDKPAMIRGSICFLFPSLYEGFGIPPLEAMACGTPTIVSNVASLPEVVGDAGIKIRFDDYKAMAEYMKRFDEDVTYREQWSKLGIERAKKFSWESSASSLLEIYNKHIKI